jgi:hypothetical protein
MFLITNIRTNLIKITPFTDMLWRGRLVMSVSDVILIRLLKNQRYDIIKGPSWLWSYGSWIYNNLCNQCLSHLMLWFRISIRARYITLCDKVCQLLSTGRWFSPRPPVSSTNKTYCNNNLHMTALYSYIPLRSGICNLLLQYDCMDVW